MFSTSRIIGSFVLSLAITTTASAQFVSMIGEYTESNGFVVNIPNNQPNVACGEPGPTSMAPAVAPMNDARCHGVRRTVYDPPQGPLNFFTPEDGVPNRLFSSVMGGANVGDQFTIPTGFFGQEPANPGISVGGPVIANAVIWISSAFTARLPAAARQQNPPASTRVMRAQGQGPIPGQPGRPTGPPAVIVNQMDDTDTNDSGTLTYTEGPNKFGGTMSLLLDGQANLYIKTAAFDAQFTVNETPVLARQPVGDPTVSLMERNGAGWNYPILGGQVPGTVFGPTGATIVPCELELPATPADCNLPPNIPPIAPILDQGVFLPSATSTKFAFPWTTGTVVAVVNAVRGPQGTFAETLTGMGYDTVTGNGVRQVGLVAGSYTNRTAGTGVQLASQIVGINLRLTPEPASAVALFAGVGLLGFAATRRRRS